MIDRHDSIVVQTFVRLLTPLAQLFALYVLAHGHESPGGGFQAGVILAATYILIALALGRETFERRADERLWLGLASLGVLIYVATGIVGMLYGGTFLDYAALPLPVPAATARYFGILFIEIGVMLAVAATLTLLFARLADREPR